MIRFTFNKIIICFLFLFFALLTAAQNRISVNASTDKNKILIGERILLSLEATFPSGSTPIHFFSIDSIPHFIIALRGKKDTVKTATGISLKQVFQITSFDSGRWVVPSFNLDKKIRTNPIPVEVVFSDFDAKKDYHDLKGIIELPAEKNQNWWLLPGILSVLVIAAMVLLWRRKKSKSSISHVKEIDPYREALLQLEQVQKKAGMIKQYYSSLTDIFRLYLFRKKGILSLQETTGDLVEQLYKLDLNKELFNRLSHSLELSDSVKFAKYVPSEQDDKVFFETLKNSIQQIENNHQG